MCKPQIAGYFNYSTSYVVFNHDIFNKSSLTCYVKEKKRILRVLVNRITMCKPRLVVYLTIHNIRDILPRIFLVINTLTYIILKTKTKKRSKK